MTRIVMHMTAAVLIASSVLSIALIPAATRAAENPPLRDACGGVDIVLVIDSSDSVTDGARGTTDELGLMRAAFESVIDAMLPSTPSDIAVIDFDQGARVTAYTTDASVARTALANVTRGGGTDWASALDAVSSLVDPHPERQDVIIFASDGNPNHLGQPSVATSTEAALRAAVAVADALKAGGSRIIAVGVGNADGDDALDIANLAALSGPRIDTGDASSDVITSGFERLAADLRRVSEQLCGTPGGGGNGPPVGSLPPQPSGSVANSASESTGNGIADEQALPGIPNTGAPAYPGVPNTGGGGRGLTPLLLSSMTLMLCLCALLLMRKDDKQPQNT